MPCSFYLCVTFIFISLGLVRLVSLMRKGWVVEPILLFYIKSYKTSFLNNPSIYPNQLLMLKTYMSPYQLCWGLFI